MAMLTPVIIRKLLTLRKYLKLSNFRGDLECQGNPIHNQFISDPF